VLISWDQFKAQASADLSADGAFIYRGQRDSAWPLVSTLHRTTIVRSFADMKSYADLVLPRVHEAIESWTGKRWDLSNNLALAEYLAFLQHNGFPTPLLDWTYSPYIGAYFAFESVNHFAPQNQTVAIYSFNANAWSQCYKQHYDFADFTPHVSVLRPRTIGNHKLTLQQGCFTWSNIRDIGAHILLNETEGRTFLKKYELAVTERPRIMKELSLMGISAIQLTPCVESVCKKALEDFIGLIPIGG
jgi:hypothetical protein